MDLDADDDLVVRPVDRSCCRVRRRRFARAGQRAAAGILRQAVDRVIARPPLLFGEMYVMEYGDSRPIDAT